MWPFGPLVDEIVVLKSSTGKYHIVQYGPLCNYRRLAAIVSPMIKKRKSL